MLNISLLTLGKLSILILPSYLRDMRAILIHRHGSHVTWIRLYFLNFTLIAEKVKAHQPSCQWKWIIRFIITRQLEQNSWEHIKDDHQIIKVENDKRIIKIHTMLDVSFWVWYFWEWFESERSRMWTVKFKLAVWWNWAVCPKVNGL